MHFGLFYLFSDFGNIPQDQVFNEVLDEIEYAEELGFDSIWLPEHHFAVYGMLGNPLTLAAAIAQRTTKMKIGTAVMILPFQHPLRVAEDAALVDALSGGRLLLGLGRGYQPPEFHGFGVPQSDSSAMFNESIEIIKRALSGEKFTFEGQFWNIEEPTEIFPKPIQKPRPTVMVGGRSDYALRRAAKYADGWNPSQPSATQLATSLPTLHAYFKEAGRGEPTEIGINIHSVITSTDEAAHVIADPSASKMFPNLNEYRERTILGNPDTFTRRVQEYVDAGANYIELKPFYPDIDHLIDQMRLIHDEVMPAFI